MTKPHVEIRRPHLRELPSLQRLFSSAVKIHFAYFPNDYQQRIIRENNLLRLWRASRQPNRTLYVAVSDGKVIGYIIGTLETNHIGYIFWLFISPEQRGGNLGLKLLSRMLRHLEQAGATKVVLGTYDHQAYYRRQGFREDYVEQLEGIPITYMSFNWNHDETPS